MSDGIFYYPKYLLYGKIYLHFVHGERQRHETGREHLGVSSLTANQSVFMLENE